MGLEPTITEYVDGMAKVFREVHRVLRKDGTLWLVLGDSYAGGRRGGGSNGSKQQTNQESLLGPKSAPDGLKPKDLCGIPWRVAFALQEDGWYLRSDMIWSKPNPMPESVTDRPTKAHEYLFLLSKSERYYYDIDAIREPFVYAGDVRVNTAYAEATGKSPSREYRHKLETDGRNRRTVWEIATAPFSGAHFATMPPALVEPCILAGCPERCCAKCGAPWVKQLSSPAAGGTGKSWHDHTNDLGKGMSQCQDGKPMGNDFYKQYKGRQTVGFSPSCSCNSGTAPGVCLDPFGGAGTVGLVADRLGRNAILIELNHDYAAMAERRIRDDAGMFASVAAE